MLWLKNTNQNMRFQNVTRIKVRRKVKKTLLANFQISYNSANCLKIKLYLTNDQHGHLAQNKTVKTVHYASERSFGNVAQKPASKTVQNY